MFISINI